MESTVLKQEKELVISPDELLAHWLGHRRVTRKAIEVFPEKEFFSFSIGKMRTAAELVQELLAIAVPGLRELALGTTEELKEKPDDKDKQHFLDLWDESTEQITELWSKLPENTFRKEVLAFGQYPGTGSSTIFYYIDNEIHHRGQIYVYLRALGIEPPFFWER